MRSSNYAWGTMLLVCVGALHADPDERTKQSARAVLKKHQDAVITVRVTGKITAEFNGQKTTSSFKVNLIGTVLTADGLTALCTTSLAESVFPGSLGKQTSHFNEVTLITKEGREFDAELISDEMLRGVTFAVPKKRGLEFPYLSIEKQQTPMVLDDVILVSRLSEVLDREPAVAIARVSAVVEKQKLAVLDGTIDGGTAAFSTDGRALGICIVRFSVETREADISDQRVPCSVLLTHEYLKPGMDAVYKKWKDEDK